MRKNKWIIGIVVVAVLVTAAALVNTKYQKGAFQRELFRPPAASEFEVIYYTLSVKSDPSILRVVGWDDIGTGNRIVCGTDCSERYPAGTVVSLGVSVIDHKFAFNGYTGDCTEGSCVLTMNSDKVVKVHYRRR